MSVVFRDPIPSSIKEGAVRRYLSTDLTLRAIATELGVTTQAVSRWVMMYEGRNKMSQKRKPSASPKVTTPDTRSAEDKLRVLIEAAGLPEEKRGEFLRREGLRDGDLERFRSEALGGLGGTVHSAADRRRIDELERASAKQERRLREAEALLDLQKKVHALWGEKDEDTEKS